MSERTNDGMYGPRDPEALLEHDDFLRALARSLVADDARASDVVQQAYVAALTDRAGGPQRSGSLRAWLASVVRHVAGKLRRAETRRAAHERAAAKPEALPSVADVVAREQARRRVVEAVLRLEEPTRTTMLLRYFDRLPPRAIAKKLGVPVETVRTRIKRALERLRGELDRDYGGEGGASTGRSAWLAALVPFTKAAPLGPIAAATSATTAAAVTIVSGVLVMSAKAKLISAAGVVASAALAWVFFHGDAAIDASNARAGAPGGSMQTPAATTLDHDAAATAGAVDATRTAEEPTTVAARDAAAAADPRLATLVVKAKWGRDGSPAADVMLSLYVWGRPDPHQFLSEARTDARGIARFEEIEPGSVLVVGDRSGEARDEVAAGKTTELELTLANGVDVEGEVVDAKGHPVADAAIWLAFDGAGWTDGSVVARSDGHGLFGVASVTGSRNLGARKAGYAPSSLQEVQGNPGTTVHVKVELVERGGLVRGRVVGPDGMPVLGAIVQLGDERKLVRSSATPTMFARVLRTRSDADGRFAFDGAMTGEQPLAVRSRELAPWIGRVTVNADAPSDLLVGLPRGATLEGLIVDGERQPVGGVNVTVQGSSELATTERRSAPDGTYRFEHVMPGTLDVRAELEEKSGRSHAQLSFVDGETTRWDPVLSSGLALRGRVVDEDGRPFSKCWIEATGPDAGSASGWFMRGAQVAADGRFELAGCPATEFSLEVRPLEGWSDLVRLPQVRASDEELVITISSDRLSSVFLEGVVVGEDDRPLDNATVVPSEHGATRARCVTVDPGTGRFRAGPYAPGDFLVRALAAGYAERFVAADDVVRDETRELGTIRLERGAAITVHAHDESGKTPEGLSLVARVAGTENFPRFEVTHGTLRVERAAPGDYEVSASAPGFVPAFRTATVENGKPAELEITLRAGRIVSVRASFSPLLRELLASEETGRKSCAWLRDASGATLSKLWIGRLGDAVAGTPDSPWTCKLALLPGRHTLELVVDGEPTAAATFDVPAANPSDGSIDAAASPTIDVALE